MPLTCADKTELPTTVRSFSVLFIRTGKRLAFLKKVNATLISSPTGRRLVMFGESVMEPVWPGVSSASEGATLGP